MAHGTRPPAAWRLGVAAARLVLRRVYGWRVQPRLPALLPHPGDPLVVVFNHTSNVDALLVADTVWRRLGHWVQPLMKAELMRVPVLGSLARRAGAIPVARSRGSGREAAYDAAVERLRAGGSVLIAPEGTITHDGSLLPLRHGAARLALEAGVNLLVVTHFGAQRGFSPVVRVPERDVVVTMTLDVVSPWADDDAQTLTGRIAATMLDRSDELRDYYPQADPTAPWWPPYAEPAPPTAVARDSLARYRTSMAEAIEQARTRMARLADEYDLERRLSDVRHRAKDAAEDLAARSRTQAARLADRGRSHAEELVARGRAQAGELVERGKAQAEELVERGKSQAEEIVDRSRRRLSGGAGGR